MPSNAADTRSPFLRVLVAIAAAFAFILAGLVVPTAAQAAESAVTIDKQVDGLDLQDGLAPGDEFIYTVDLACFDADCQNVVLTDTLPAELAGFEIVGATYTPTTVPLTLTSEGCVEDGAGNPVEVSDSCTYEVDFQQPIDDGAGEGLAAGGTLKLSLALQVPADLPADWEYNTDQVTNTASTTWDNGPGEVPTTITDSADVIVTVPTTVAVEASKSWEPASQQFEPGVESTITIGAQNQSNLGGDSLVIQEPTSAADGANSLGADNPFRIVDFAGFASTTLPPDATTVQVDAYVYDEGTGTWSWVSGAPAAAPALPDGVEPAEVGGIRLTYAGGTIEADAAASTAFTVEQRSTDRNDDSSLNTGSAVTNEITSTVNAGDQTDSDTAEAPYTIGALTIDVGAEKTITPGELAAGGESTAQLVVRNDSNGPVQTMTVSEQGFFDADMVFGGFPTGIAYPAGATAATITWYVDGVAQTPVPFANGEAPVAPAGVITGFDIVFTGDIEAGAAATFDVTILPAVTLVSEAEPTASRTNTIDVTAENAVGEATNEAEAPITVYFPEISIALQKNISPGGAVEPGTSVVAGLTATTGSGTAQVSPTQIVVEDSWREGDSGDFWNAFDVAGIAPTQVPANTTLTVVYWTADGVEKTLTVVPAQPTAQTFQMTSAEMAAALTPPDTLSDVTGIRFVFDNPDGFPQGFSVEPNVVFDARSELRDGSGPTDARDEPEDDAAAQEPTIYEDEARAQSHADVDGIPDGISSDIVPATDTIGVQVPADGEGPVGVDKRWVDSGDKTTDVNVLDAQSGAVVSTRNEWRVGTPGVQQLILSDPATPDGQNPDGPADTVFQAFDLLSIDPVSLADDPLLAWDDIAEVRLFTDGAWTVIPAPDGSWTAADGSFKGYTLTAEQTAGTTGVALVYVSDDAARAASTDPTRPEPGSGLATSAVGQYRPSFLTWELRNVVRDDAGLDAPWVTQDQLFNDDESGTIWNTVRGDYVTAEGPGFDSDQDNIALIDQPPLVNVTKTAEPATVTIPESADVDPANYPTVTFDIVGGNGSTARASYVRLTDPITCEAGSIEDCVSAPDAWDADPFDGAAYDADSNPYERLNILSLAFAYPASVDPTASMATLWDRAEDGTLSTRTMSITDAAALAEGDLATVVGVSAVFQGTDPETDGGLIANGDDLGITIQTRVRQYERSDADQLVAPGTVDNDVIAQSYDPVLTPSGQASTPFDQSDASVQLLVAMLDATLEKTIAPETLLEPQLGDPVAVTLDATDGESTAATHQVVITDDDADFWNGVRLADTPNLAATLPAGADQVRIDALVGADWTEGAFGPTATLPAVDPTAVVGLRAVYSNSTGEVLSHANPPADWTAQLRFDVQVLTTQRDGTELAPPATIPNQATVLSERTDGRYADADDTADASLNVEPGTHTIDVVKAQPGTSHIVGIGSSLPWTLTFTNTGTGFLTIDELVDTLPEYLEWDFSDPTYVTSDGGTLSTDVTAVADETGKIITFTWPEGGQQMSPGESFTITINLTLLPGLGLEEFTTNSFVVTTAEELSACTNTSGNGEGTIDGLDANQCGTTNYVQPAPGGALSASKWVKGEIDGALVDGQVNPANPAQACPLDADGYTRMPCAAYTAVGATDDWKVSVLNAGTVGFPTVSIVDPLPQPGDRMLATGSARNSTFANVLIRESLSPEALPAGATYTFDVTTSAAPCYGTGTGSAWFGDLLCDTTADWVPILDYTGAWEAVTGMRATIDFAATASGVFGPGDELGLHYQTRNTPASAEFPDLAPIEVPDQGGFAWNQIGAVGTDAAGAEYSVAPVQAGVTLLNGDLGLEKVIDGAADLAPDAFQFDVVCTVDGVPLTLPGGGSVTLTADADYTSRIDGLPLGSVCDVTETGDPGSYGEIDRSEPQQVEITTPATDDGEIPETQVASITNTFQYSGLSVTKTVETDAEGASFGPFDFTLSCTDPLGEPVEFEGGVTELPFTLSDGETFTAPEDTIPANSTCLITEVDSAAADEIVVVGNNVTDNGDGSATVLVGTTDATVEFTNGFDSGILTVQKIVDGEGGALYGDGPFDFTAVCTYQGQTLLDETFVLEPGAQRTFGVYPTGTECVVAETSTGGATSTVLDPVDGVVVISDDADAAATVTATNTFDLTSIQIVKEITGPAAAYADDEYLVDVVCTVRGQDVPLGDDAVVELNEANGFAYRIDGIPTGASCDVTEQGELGEYGETGRTGSPTVIDVTEVVAPDAEVPAAQVATVTNDYTYSGLSISKIVDTEAEAEFGPFGFTLTCTSATGIPVVFDGDATEVAFTLEGGETFTAPEDTIPANSTCLIAEVDSAAADEIVIVGDNVTDNGDGTATVQVGTEPASVEFTNGFDAGILTVQKVVDGAGAELWGAGPFEFTAVCTYQDQTLLDETFVLEPNAQRTFGTYPTGTECTVAETETAGATTSVLDPTDGVVTVGEDEGATVTATNTFALTSIEVVKTVTGDAADYASDEFRADVVCTVGGANVPLGADASVVLNEANGFTQRIDGIPTGATCEVTEQGAVGEFGETTRPAPVAIVTADAVVTEDDEVPAEQTAELVNDYAFSGLSITKRVDAEAEAGYGPFDFTLSCTSATGIPVTFGDAGTELTFSLEADGTFTAPENTIPARSECLITEVGATADGMVITGDGVTDNGDGTASVQVGVDEAEIEFTNSFDSGVLTVGKVVDGAGADLYGTGEFTFTAVCTYDGQTLLDETFALAGGATRSFGPYPTNTECVVEETDAGGATSTVLDPSDGTVVLEADGTATVTATNTFDVASITVTKERVGDLNADGAHGSFTVRLECADGVTVPGGAERVLSAQGGYTTVFRDLPVGADCRISETDAGGAVKTTIVVTAADGTAATSDGTSADVALDGDVDVEITNEFVAGLPATGLAMPIILGILVLLLLGGGALVLLIARRRRALDA
ncbi:hypothetical protein M2317_001366 [Microbacterium sp. ZKA21]|uniref:DUF5979 domain-containing protein n=1 Tax=Microbacterium sp. ZKA21 TaxID=3381694 RepID=UPI003D2594C7